MNTTLRSKDLSCPSCIAKIESGLRKLEGVNEVAVHFNSGRIEVAHDESKVDVGRLQQVIRDLGYETSESPF